MTELAAIELIGISKRFGTFSALDQADVKVLPGSVHGLLGENGAGKTTLMRIAFGMLQPDQGEIRIEGNRVRLDNPAAAIAHGIGMVHQHPANVPAMTVSENLELGQRGSYSPSAARRSASELATRVGFSLDVDSPVGQLGIAAQQRLEILKAIGHDARILIFDEPTAVLAPAEAQELLAWLRAFAAGGGTAIVITHKLDEARAYTDAITVLRRGRTVLARATKDVVIPEIAAAMIGAGPIAAAPRRAETAAGDIVVSATDVTVNGEQGTVGIRDASFDVRRGEVVGIVGVEGSGHHALLLALAGRATPSSGVLTLPAQIGFVPEDRHRDAVVLDFSLTENVAIHAAGRRHGAMHWRSIADRTSRLIARFDIRTRGPSERMTALSGGNQQRLVLAREIDSEPDLLILENPTRGLDIRAAAFVREQIQASRDRGMAVVLYSSDLDEVIDAADRMLVVHGGRVSTSERNRVDIGAAMLGLA